jgi:glycerol uptake operon antiterminator
MAQRSTLLNERPVIASVKDDAALVRALASKCQTLFILYGDITNIESIVNRAKKDGRTVLVNLDMVDGYATRAVAIKHLQRRTHADGILSSKAVLVRAAKDLGMIAVHRLFMIDSFAYHQLPDQARSSQADCLEILPGCLPRVIGWIRGDTDLPLIAGGLVCDANDVVTALRAGAEWVATSDQSLWDLPLSRADILRRPLTSGPPRP